MSDGYMSKVNKTIRDVDVVGATDVITNLEKVQMTKEILEATRIGGIVNEIRKRTQDSHSQLSKRCRVLIKLWQKLVERRPPSSCDSSSTGGTPLTTPSLVSPMISRALNNNSKLTPPTTSGVRSHPVTPSAAASNIAKPPPIRVIITGLKTSSPTIDNGRSSISPKCRDAPVVRNNQQTDSNINNQSSKGSLPKSYSVGTELLHHGTKDDDIVAESTSTATILQPPTDHNQTNNTNLVNGSSRKRKKVQTFSPPSSVASRRQKALPTTALIADLTQNLPDHMTINLGEIRTDNGELLSTEQSSSIVESRQQRLSDDKNSKKRSKREKRKLKHNDNESMPPSQQVHKADLVQQYLDTSISKNVESIASTSSSSIECGTKRDWYSTLPPIDYSLITNIDNNNSTSSVMPSSRERFVIELNNRQIVAMPFVDIGLPDFIEYQYPDAHRYLADQNFIYGRPRDHVPQSIRPLSILFASTKHS